MFAQACADRLGQGLAAPVRPPAPRRRFPFVGLSSHTFAKLLDASERPIPSLRTPSSTRLTPLLNLVYCRPDCKGSVVAGRRTGGSKEWQRSGSRWSEPARTGR